MCCLGTKPPRCYVSLESIYTQQTSTARDSTAQDKFMSLLVKTIQTAPKVVLCDAGANDELLEWLESILGNEKVHCQD